MECQDPDKKKYTQVQIYRRLVRSSLINNKNDLEKHECGVKEHKTKKILFINQK